MPALTRVGSVLCSPFEERREAVYQVLVPHHVKREVNREIQISFVSAYMSQYGLVHRVDEEMADDIYAHRVEG